MITIIITKSNKAPYFPVKHKAEAQMHCAHKAQAGTLAVFKTAAFLKNNPSFAIV
ncbi:hypothetical protein D3C72_390910 [compost metagenome]